MSDRLRVGFVLEQALGHVSHAQNIEAVVENDSSLEAVLLPIPFDVEGAARYVPGYGNWTLRSGLRARRALRQARREHGPLDALFVHTQVPGVLLQDQFRRFPTIVSIDATPKQYDQLGSHYGHSTSGERLEALKFRANRRCFDRADRIVAWSAWAKAGLVEDYDVDEDKVEVIPPGVRCSLWRRENERPLRNDGRVRILFVGGDLERKGGNDLIDAFRRLRTRSDARAVELHLVTNSSVVEGDGIVVHDSMTPNSAELVALYHRCHIFCLPTIGDCLPMVLSEAGAAGLPLISTTVGAIPEIVRPNDTGLAVPTHDIGALVHALERLVHDAELRVRLGRNASALVEQRFDADTNVRRLIESLRDMASGDGVNSARVR